MTGHYAAASARLRDAALKAGMLPSQGQETIWSTAMQLYELAKEHGIHPREVLERNMLTPGDHSRRARLLHTAERPQVRAHPRRCWLRGPAAGHEAV